MSFWSFAWVSQLLYSKICKKLKISIQRFRAFVVELEVASKLFSKMLPRTEFLFKHFWTLCLTFGENGLNVATQKFVKNWKMAFSKVHNICFDLKAASKPFSKILPMNNFEFEKLKRFQLGHWKICKKVKNAILKRSGDSVTSKVSF